MYQVIIILDESRQRSYYHSYEITEDTTAGNITTEDLPPYADIQKAHSCYWDGENNAWVYDADKHREIVEQAEAEAEAKEQEAEEKAATPTNLELMEAIMEIAQNQSDLEDAVTELADMVAGTDETTEEQVTDEPTETPVEEGGAE